MLSVTLSRYRKPRHSVPNLPPPALLRPKLSHERLSTPAPFKKEKEERSRTTKSAPPYPIPTSFHDLSLLRTSRRENFLFSFIEVLQCPRPPSHPFRIFIRPVRVFFSFFLSFSLSLWSRTTRAPSPVPSSFLQSHQQFRSLCRGRSYVLEIASTGRLWWMDGGTDRWRIREMMRRWRRILRCLIGIVRDAGMYVCTYVPCSCWG